MVSRRRVAHSSSMCVFFSDDEPECRYYATVPPRGAQDATAHPAALLRLQSLVGLGHPVSDLLHGHHGPLQRRLQEQDVRGRQPAGRRLDRRRHLLHRHCPQLPHDVRRSRGGSRVRPESYPHELPQELVRH